MTALIIGFGASVTGAGLFIVPMAVPMLFAFASHRRHAPVSVQ